MDLVPVAQRLAVAREAVLTRIAALSAEIDSHVAATAGSNADDEHDPEGATLAWERQQLAAARGAAQQQLVDLDAALARVATGRYGACERCGHRIGADRLDALPATRFCITCAR